MTDDMPDNEKEIIDEIMKRRQLKNQRFIPSEKVHLFLVMIGDQIERTGELNKEYVDQLMQQLKSGTL